MKRVFLMMLIAFIFIGCETDIKDNNVSITYTEVEDNEDSNVTVDNSSTTTTTNNITTEEEVISYDYNLSYFFKYVRDLELPFDSCNWDTHDMTNIVTNVGTITTKEDNVTIDFDTLIIPDFFKEVITTEVEGVNEKVNFYETNTTQCRVDRYFENVSIDYHNYRNGIMVICKHYGSNWYLYFTHTKGLSMFIDNNRTYYIGIY